MVPNCPRCGLFVQVEIPPLKSVNTGASIVTNWLEPAVRAGELSWMSALACRQQVKPNLILPGAPNNAAPYSQIIWKLLRDYSPDMHRSGSGSPRRLLYNRYGDKSRSMLDFPDLCTERSDSQPQYSTSKLRKRRRLHSHAFDSLAGCTHETRGLSLGSASDSRQLTLPLRSPKPIGALR